MKDGRSSGQRRTVYEDARRSPDLRCVLQGDGGARAGRALARHGAREPRRARRRHRGGGDAADRPGGGRLEPDRGRRGVARGGPGLVRGARCRRRARHPGPPAPGGERPDRWTPERRERWKAVARRFAEAKGRLLTVVAPAPGTSDAGAALVAAVQQAGWRAEQGASTCVGDVALVVEPKVESTCRRSSLGVEVCTASLLLEGRACGGGALFSERSLAASATNGTDPEQALRRATMQMPCSRCRGPRGSPSSTSPMTAASATPAAASAATSAPARPGSTAARSPPFVCASASTTGQVGASPSATRRWGVTQRRFAFEPPGTTSFAARSWTPVEDPDGARAQAQPDAGAVRHLPAVAEEAEPGDVGERVDGAALGEDLARRAVERRHELGDPLDERGARELALHRGRRDAGAEGLGEEEGVAGARADVPQDPVGVDEPGDRQAVLGLRVVDGVAAQDRRAGEPRRLRAAAQHLAEHVHRQLPDGPADDVEREERAAAHGPDVREGVRRGDPSEPVRVVHHRREEVHRLDDGALRVETVHRGVVARVVADERARIVAPREMAQDLRQIRRAESCRLNPRRARAR